MEKRNKKILIILFSLGMVFLTLGVSVAFFNYTRTGGANTVRVGRISFNATQNGTINLSNVFPITSTEAETDTNNSDTVSLRIVGDTDYDKGIEYLVSLDDVNITVNNKKVPITLDVSVTGTGLGSEETGDYYTNRESYTESKYKKEIGNNLNNGSHVIVGYISKNETLGTASGIDGTINIKAYIDADRIAISDTYDGTESDNMGTTTEWVDGRTVFTTNEWNNLNLSFKIKVEANEGIWVEKPATSTNCFDKQLITLYTLNPNMTQEELNYCISYINSKNYTFDNGGTAEDYCRGTEKLSGRTFQLQLDYYPDELDLNALEEHNLISSEMGIELSQYDNNCGQDVVLPENVSYIRLLHNSSMSSDEINSCISYFENNGYSINTGNGETMEKYCNGTGAMLGKTFQQLLDEEYFSEEQITNFKSNNYIVDDSSKKYPVLSVSSLVSWDDTVNNVTFNKTLKRIGNHSEETIYINYPNFYDIVIPANVRTINGNAFYAKDTVSEGVTIPNTHLTILGNPSVDVYSLPAYETIRYGGTCQELKRETNMIIESKNYTDYQTINVITSDTNSCEVINGFRE